MPLSFWVKKNSDETKSVTIFSGKYELDGYVKGLGIAGPEEVSVSFPFSRLHAILVPERANETTEGMPSIPKDQSKYQVLEPTSDFQALEKFFNLGHEIRPVGSLTVSY